MTWISVNDKMPNDVWIEEMYKINPNVDWSESIDQILFDCLVNFADTDDGKVYDCEVIPVMYNTREGWMRKDWSKFSDQDVLELTHWMSIPDAVSCKDAKVVYDENVAKHVWVWGQSMKYITEELDKQLIDELHGVMDNEQVQNEI